MLVFVCLCVLCLLLWPVSGSQTPLRNAATMSSTSSACRVRVYSHVTYLCAKILSAGVAACAERGAQCAGRARRRRPRHGPN